MKRNKQKSFKSKAPKFRELNIESSEDSSNFVAEHRASSSEVDELDIDSPTEFDEDDMEHNVEDDSLMGGGQGHQSGVSDTDLIEANEAEKTIDPEEEIQSLTNPMELLNSRLLDKDRVLVALQPGAEIHFKGCLKVKVIKGAVSCQGYTLRPSHEFCPVYSSRGRSLLSICAANEVDTCDNFEDLLSSEKLTMADLAENKVYFIAIKLSAPWIDFLKKNCKDVALFGREEKYKETLTEMEKQLDITIFRPEMMSAKLWREGEEWNTALVSMNLSMVASKSSNARLVATGGKGVGKSTFLRWLTNKLLMDKGKILFACLDPGQGEFALPGYISLSLLTKPLLGTNFCHDNAVWHKSIYFGDISVTNNPGRYIACARRILKWAKETKEEAPLLINTMGWCKGLGFALNIDIIRMSEPSTVIQLYSRFTSKNYPASLSPDFVSTSKSSWRKKPTPLSYSLLEFSAVPERKLAKDMRSKDSWGMPQPKVHRDIKVLAWLGRVGGVQQMPIYSILLSQVSLNVAHMSVDPRGLLAALLMKPVDLCTVQQSKIKAAKHSDHYSILDASPISESKGTGIVRGFNPESKMIYVATEVEESILKTVNCLVGGSLSIPDPLVMKGTPGTGYLCIESGDTNPLDQPWQRHHNHTQFSLPGS